MRRITLALAILTLATFGLTQSAHAQDGLELSIAVVSTQQKPMRLNDFAHFNVTLSNKSDKAIENLKTLDFDRQSVYLQITFAGKTFSDTRIHNAPGDIKKYKRFKLEPKASKSMEISMPLLKADKYSVAAIYMGGKGILRSKPLEIKVEPKNGQKETTIKMLTNRGEVTIKLYPEKALGTCNNFVRHIHEKFYNGLIFHRVIKNFMIQGGCPNGTGSGGPGFCIPYEDNDLGHEKGRLAMAHATSKDSGGTQFYICTGWPRHLNKKHTVFGEVKTGLDVVEVHGNTKTAAKDRPAKPQRIRKMTLVP